MGLLEFNNDIKEINPETRHVIDMKDLFLKKDFEEEDLAGDLYYMYRGLKENGELRYDVTIIPPRLIGNEFVKTKGHYHITGHQELYTVIDGEAIFLFQKGEDEIEDAYYVKAKKGESVIVKKDYTHITINPSKKTLKLANWISKRCESFYLLMQEKRGACYFYTTNGWVKNNNYRKIPELREEFPLKEIPQDLSFLLKT